MRLFENYSLNFVVVFMLTVVAVIAIALLVSSKRQQKK